MNTNRTVMTLSIFIGLMVIGAVIGSYMSRYYQQQVPQAVEGLLWPNPKQLGAFTMVDHEGREFTLEDLKGKWSFLFFGYTYCPDVCPVTMAMMNEVYKQLADNNESSEVQTIFVTVDPARDTTQRLREFMGFFNEEFIGLGGSIEQVEGLASQIGVAYIYGTPTEEGDYLVEHTSSLFLLDPGARLVSIISPPYTAESVLTRYDRIKAFISDQAGP